MFDVEHAMSCAPRSQTQSASTGSQRNRSPRRGDTARHRLPHEMEDLIFDVFSYCVLPDFQTCNYRVPERTCFWAFSDSKSRHRLWRGVVRGSAGVEGSWLDQRFSAAMGCCSMDTLVSGCCCCNAAIVLPPKIGCRGDIMVCCADVTCCFDLGSICNPGACCCCGPTCKCNATLCKLKCTVFCFDVQGSCPCDSDTPIICTLLPCCTIYPRSACCATRASIVKKPKASDAPKNETMDRGSPPRNGLQSV